MPQQQLEHTHYQSILKISTRPAAFHRITTQVEDGVRESQIQLGLCHITEGPDEQPLGLNP
ncbi:MAG: hypothetical protein HC921_00455 [Synechococcaceae cyanobacterium SM2_3_1]|nr:hypothetical protein [Synechococcaceae cyanobacterium SM2_3_1]